MAEPNIKCPPCRYGSCVNFVTDINDDEFDLTKFEEFLKNAPEETVFLINEAVTNEYNKRLDAVLKSMRG